MKVERKGRVQKTVDEIHKKSPQKNKKRKTKSLKNKRQFGVTWVIGKNRRVKSSIMNSVGFN